MPPIEGPDVREQIFFFSKEKNHSFKKQAQKTLSKQLGELLELKEKDTDDAMPRSFPAVEANIMAEPNAVKQLSHYGG
jgi:hypothetical protein